MPFFQEPSFISFKIPTLCEQGSRLTSTLMWPDISFAKPENCGQRLCMTKVATGASCIQKLLSGVISLKSPTALESKYSLGTPFPNGK